MAKMSGVARDGTISGVENPPMTPKTKWSSITGQIEAVRHVRAAYVKLPNMQSKAVSAMEDIIDGSQSSALSNSDLLKE